MELSFVNDFNSKYDYLEDQYQRLMTVCFKRLEINNNYEVDVNLVDEKTIHSINRDYRKVDRVTDVISFAFNDDEDNRIADPDIPVMLGEIFICIPRALEQAKEIGNTEERELLFLFCHGLLHLLGYDHMKKEDEEIMFPLQEEIISFYKEEEEK